MDKTAIRQNFERIYIDHQPQLLAYVLRFVGNRVEAQDLAHDCFLNLWNTHSSLFSEETEVIRLLFTTARNRCLDYLKHKNIVQKHMIDSLARMKGEERLYNYDFGYNETDRPYLYQELEFQIQTIMNSLPDRCREVFILSRFQGLKNREIAAQLHISLQAVEKHIQKAMRTFLATLNDNESIYLKTLLFMWLMSPNN